MKKIDLELVVPVIYDCGTRQRAEAHMHKTVASTASLATAFLGAAITGCASHHSVARVIGMPPSQQFNGRTCALGSDCLEMSSAPAPTCLTNQNRCTASGFVRPL